MANFGGHYSYSYDTYPLVIEEDEDEDDVVDIKPLLVGGVLRPNHPAVPSQEPHNFEPPHTSPPPLRPSPDLVILPHTSSSQSHGGPQFPHENAPDPGCYDDDFQDGMPIGEALFLDEDEPRSRAHRFDCRFCGRHFSSEDNRILHEQGHSRDRPFACSYCGRTFSFKHSMLRHERTVHREEMTELPSGAFMSSQAAAAEVPRFREVSEAVAMTKVAEVPCCSTSQVEAPPPEVTEKSDLICKHCGSRFMNKNTLLMHEKMHTGEPPFRCSFCNKGFSFKLPMDRHEHYEHGKEMRRESIDSQNSVVNIPVSTPPSVPLALELTPIIQEADLKSNQCRYCGKVWRNRDYLKIHMRTHTGEQPFKCSFCDVRFSVRTNMQRHERTVHRKEMEKKSAIQSASLPEQMSSMDGHRPMQYPTIIPHVVEPQEIDLIDDARLKEYQCEYCGKIFPEKNRLNIHLRTHTGEQPYKCAYCHMRFSVRGNRNRHEMRLHKAMNHSLDYDQSVENCVTSRKQQLFNCSHCDESFNTPSLLFQHERRKHFKMRIQKPAEPSKAESDTGKQPYECCFCFQQFNHVGNMYKHQRRMHPQQLLQECGSSLTDNASQSSVESKHQRQQYSCNLCSLSFDSHKGVLEHEATEHAQLLGDGRFETLSASEASQLGFEIKTEVGIGTEETQVKCTCCEETFDQRSQMYRHLTQAHAHLFPDTTVSQPEPKRVKLTKFSNVREKTAERNERFKCGYCNQVFKYRWNAIQHENSVHSALLPQEHVDTPQSSFEAKATEAIDSLSDSRYSPNSERNRKYKCPYCEKTITRLWGWSRHLKRKHLKFVLNEDAGVTSNKSPYKCSFCSLTFTRAVIWRRHEIKRHFKLLSTRAMQIVDPSESQLCSSEMENMPSDNQLKCSYCEKTYRSLSAKFLHEKRVHSSTSGSQAAEECVDDIGFESDGNETEINRRHSDGMISKSTRNSLSGDTTTANRRHSDESALKLPVDHETFDESSSAFVNGAKVVDHQPTGESTSKELPYESSSPENHKPSKSKHTKSKYRCQYCGIQRLDRYRLIVHERSHTGERPFKCSLCGKGFAERFVMNRHKREVHFKDKANRKIIFQCHICHLRLNSAIALQQHERQHSPNLPYDCNFCGRAFETPGRLNRHKGAMHKGYRRVEEEPFGCGICGKSFLSEVQLREHRDTDHKDNCSVEEDSFNCDVCGKSFHSEHLLNQHREENCGVDGSSFDCDICGKSFSAAGRLSRHKGAVHKGYLRSEAFGCDLCSKTFPTFGRLSRHKGTVHKNGRGLEEQSFDCGLCQKSFFSLGQLNEHRDADHKEDVEEGPFDCDLCGKSFPAAGRLSRHKGAVHKENHSLEEQSFECSFCPKSFPSLRSLIQHKGAKHKGGDVVEEILPFSCDLCGKSYVSEAQLNQHKELNHKKEDYSVDQKPPFDCNLCTKSFPSSRSLIQHKGAKHKGENRDFKDSDPEEQCDIKTCPDEQAFDCNLCGVSFLSADWLKLHRDTEHKNEAPPNQHEGAEEKKAECKVKEEESFDCDICGKSFPAAGRLSRHKGAVHKGYRNRPKAFRPVSPMRSGASGRFHCTFCGILFPDRRRLDRHLKQHTGNQPFGCSICGRRFSCSQFLRRHKREYHEKKRMGLQRSPQPFQCNQCCLSFNTEHRLQQHLVVHTEVGGRKFICAVCGGQFRAKSSYYEHKRMHM